MSGRFILNNYKQALNIISSVGPEFDKVRKALGIKTNDVFEEWHKAETKFLSQKPEEVSPVETIAMDYVTTLKQLEEAS